jgi:hypothetical protein
MKFIAVIPYDNYRNYFDHPFCKFFHSKKATLESGILLCFVIQAMTKIAETLFDEVRIVFYINL